jgi:hypothetical protein
VEETEQGIFISIPMREKTSREDEKLREFAIDVNIISSLSKSYETRFSFLRINQVQLP